MYLKIPEKQKVNYRVQAGITAFTVNTVKLLVEILLLLSAIMITA